MNAFQIEFSRRAGLLAAWLLGAVVAASSSQAATAEEPAATNEVAVVVADAPAADAPAIAAPAAAETNAVATNAVAAGESPTTTNAPAAVAAEETRAPKKKEPAYRGSDMQDAFQGAGSSKFGMSGRVNKMPAKKSAPKQDGDWKRSLEVGVNTASGNSDALRCTGAASAARETETNFLFLKASGRYGESDGEKDAEEATGEGKLQHRLTERVYAALDGNAHRDRIADLDYRVRGSLSLGRHFIWTERTVLSAEAGPGYVAEKKGGEPEGFAAGRLAQYLEILVADDLQVWESTEFVQDLEDSAIYFVNAEIGLETVLTGSLSLRFAVEDRYDNQPADDKEANDLLTTTALNWMF